MEWCKVEVVLERYTNISLCQVKEIYNSYGRHWHNWKHIEFILKNITLTEDNILATVFHDIVCDVRREDNEEQSVDFFNKVCYVRNDNIEKLIMSTKDLKSNTELAVWDRYILSSNSTDDLVDYEDAIFKEYQTYDLDTYITKRVKFVEENVKHKDVLINYILNKEYNIGFYVGSFNPFTVGHFNILQQAEKVFDKVIIGAGKNVDKQIDKTPLSGLITNTHEVIEYDGYLVDVLKDKNYKVVRGLRNSKDLEDEKVLRNHLRDFSDIQTVYFICDKEYEYISSGYVRGLKEEMKNKYIV